MTFVDRGVFICPITVENVAVLLMTIRVTGQTPINPAICNHDRLAEDLPCGLHKHGSGPDGTVGVLIADFGETKSD